jgi:mono/diheme cytochrome c family protein
MTMWLALIFNAALGQADAPPAVDYLRDIKTILAEKCFACHGALKQKGDLRLDTARAMRDGGDSGPALVPGKSDESLLIDRLIERKGVGRMPPPSDGEALKPQQIAKIRAWIDAGAIAPADETPETDPRDHWAFRAPVRPAVPAAHEFSRNPIDAFLADRWRKHKLTPQPPAEGRLLLRRVYIDLIGVPPTRAEQEAYLADPSPDAFEKSVDRLLADPRYGQRWGRHWMDVWRYSDPWGLGAEIRNSQKHIWRWRDWIVESLNADAGYDTMLRDMLAADELAPNDLGRLRATGFLARQYFKFNRTTWLDDAIEHTSKAFLGLTFNCAKCHDHKYDPISQTDFYKLRAFFEPYQIRTEQIAGETDFEKDGIVRAFDGTLDAKTFLFERGDDRRPVTSKPLAPDLPRLLTWQPLDIRPVTLPAEAHSPGLRVHVLDNHLNAAQRQIDAARTALAVTSKKLADAAACGVDAKSLESLRAAVNLAEKSLATAEALPATLRLRVSAERAKLDKANDAGELSRAAARAEKELAVLKAVESLAGAESELTSVPPEKRPEVKKKHQSMTAALESARKALANPGDAFTPLRGALKTLESNVETEESRLRPFPAASTGRRSALANWLTDRRNPLTARVAVNHLWARHFGKPLVATVFDFGRKGAAPTHPELLDFLAVEFMDHGWSMKHLHRLMVTSHAYRLSSSAFGADSATLAADPENRYYWRREPVRLEAQAVRDSLLQLAGELDSTSGGPPIPIAEEMSRRRAMYFVHSHNDNQKFLALFDDAAVRECYRRSESIVPQQALALANSKVSLAMAAKINDRLHDDLGGANDDAFIRAAFEHVLSCLPSADELTECRAALEEWRAIAGGRPDAARRARGHLVHALLNHNDFVTIR